MGVGWKPGVSPLFGLTLDRYMPLFWVLGLKLEHDVCQAGYSGYEALNTYKGCTLTMSRSSSHDTNEFL